MIKEAKVSDDTHDSVVSAVFKDGADDGFEGCGNHFRRLAIRSVRDGNALFDSVVKPALSQSIVAQQFISNYSPLCRREGLV
jgi:hypothetical protein